MSANPLEPSLRAILIAGAARRAEGALGGWLDRGVIERNVTEHVAALLGGGPGPAVTASSSFQRAELVTAAGWVALAQALPTAESLPLPHVVLWAIAPLEGEAPWPSAAALTALSREAQERFKALRVARAAVFLHGDAMEPPPALRAALLRYKRWMAAPMALLRAGPAPARRERVDVSTPSDLGFWPDYVRMYEEFWASDPALRGRIGKERPGDLEEYIAAGGLRLIWIDGALAGVIGGVRMVELGLRGWRLRERVLGGRWRGAGFGSAALDAAIRDLSTEPDDLLWGTILPENRGSMGSALRLGRVDVGGLWWIDSSSDGEA